MPDIRNDQPREIGNFLLNNVLTEWTLCDACKPMFESYVPATYLSNNPLIVTGFDNQIDYPYSRKNITTWLDSAFRKINLPIVTSTEYRTNIHPLIEVKKWVRVLSVPVR